MNTTDSPKPQVATPSKRKTLMDQARERFMTSTTSAPAAFNVQDEIIKSPAKSQQKPIIVIVKEIYVDGELVAMTICDEAKKNNECLTKPGTAMYCSSFREFYKECAIPYQYLPHSTANNDIINIDFVSSCHNFTTLLIITLFIDGKISWSNQGQSTIYGVSEML